VLNAELLNHFVEFVCFDLSVPKDVLHIHQQQAARRLLNIDAIFNFGVNAF
jgi:hypothetical protein